MCLEISRWYSALARSVLFGWVWMFFENQLAAQACAMCRTAVASQPVALARTLNLGILVLIVPPIFIVCAILYRVYLYSRGEAEGISAG